MDGLVAARERGVVVSATGVCAYHCLTRKIDREGQMNTGFLGLERVTAEPSGVRNVQPNNLDEYRSRCGLYVT